MGSITRLADRSPRRQRRDGRGAVIASAYGFTVGGRTVAWQAVQEIWGCPDPDGGASLEFVAAGERMAVGERQPGFALLEAAARAVFPSVAGWRGSIAQAACAGARTLLFRRT